MHLVGFIVRIIDNARSPERQKSRYQYHLSASGISWQVEELNAKVTPAVDTVTNHWMLLSKV